MATRIRNYALIALAIGAFYFLLTHHFIFSSFTDFDLLKKTEPTLKFTFISANQIKPYLLLREQNLRDAGLAEYLLEKGFISEARLDRVMERIESETEAESGN